MFSLYRFIYDRYMLKKLLIQFAVWALFFTLLFLLSVFLEKLDIFIKHKACAGSIFIYLGWQAPFWLWKAAPLAFLGAVLTVLDDLARSGELTALEGTGLAPARIYMPIFTLAGLLAAFGLFGFEGKAPYYYRQAKAYLKRSIQKKPEKTMKPIENLVAKGRHGRYYVFGEVNPKTQAFKDLWLDEWDASPSGPIRHLREIFAKNGSYKEDVQLWLLEEVAIRRYGGWDSSGKPTVTDFEVKPKLTLSLPENLRSLMPSSWRLDEMTLSELGANIGFNADRGIAYRSLAAERQGRLAWPVSFFVLGLTATGMLTLLPRKLWHGKLLLFGITIVIGLLYWFLVNLSKTLAAHGIMAPGWAAWGPHLVLILLVWAAKKN